MRKFSNAIVSHQPDFSSTRNWTLDSTRHVHVLLSCTSELTVVFIEDVEPLASFFLKSFSWSSIFFITRMFSVILRDPGAVSRFQVKAEEPLA